jgi:hypothetical protein
MEFCYIPGNCLLKPKMRRKNYIARTMGVAGLLHSPTGKSIWFPVLTALTSCQVFKFVGSKSKPLTELALIATEICAKE